MLQKRFVLIVRTTIRAKASLKSGINVSRAIVVDDIKQAAVITFVIVKLRVFTDNPNEAIQIFRFGGTDKLQIQFRNREPKA